MASTIEDPKINTLANGTGVDSELSLSALFA